MHFQINKTIIVIIITSISFISYGWVENYAPRYTRNPLQLNTLDASSVNAFFDWKNIPELVQRNVYSADLNLDGKPDYIIETGTTMCGLWAAYSTVTFILSSSTGYVVTKTGCMDFEPQDIIQAKGGNYFLMTTFLYWSAKNGHNYWHHRLFSFEKNGKLRSANKDVGMPFPSYIQYTNKPNEKQSAILKASERVDIWKHGKEKFWFADYESGDE